jgi:putative nucleotidyltransferase with HDIG domain
MTGYTRADALALLHEYTQSEALRRHALQVEASMRAYARKYGGDEETWGIVGLLHDFDYERFPSETQHPYEGARILRERGWPEEIVEGVLAHAPFTNTPYDTPLKRCIFAVDELSGFIYACALMYGRSLDNLDAARIKKKLKDKNFARGVLREDIAQSLEILGVELDEHIATVLEAQRGIANEIGLIAAAGEATAPGS